MDLGLEGRRCVVTGGTKGLGEAITTELLREGAAVAICARHADEVEQAVARLGAFGTVHGWLADVTDATQVEEFVAAAASGLGGIDVLVNNAGGARPGTFTSLSEEEFRADLNTKLFSQLYCARAALERLRASPAGRVINVNAIYGRQPDRAFFATTVNRAACLAFNKVLAQELGPAGVLVNSVNIGFIETPQWETIRARRAPEMQREEFFASFVEREVPLGRFGRPEEVSGLVAFLASDRASYITGASIDVGGGMGRYV